MQISVVGLTSFNAEIWTLGLESLFLYACAVAAIGLIPWSMSADRGLARLFRAGPALLVPVVYLWSVVSHYFCRGEEECSNDIWRVIPFYVAIGAALFWHATLILRNRERLGLDVVYAVIFMPAFYLFCMYGMVLAIKFPL
jgi:hypothetical protein